MRDAQIKGSIINIASIAGLDRGQLPGGAAYASSKAGVNMLTKVTSFDIQLFSKQSIFLMLDLQVMLSRI